MRVCVLQRPSSTPSYPSHPTPSPSGSFVFFKSLLVALAMSIARDDMGNIRDMHTAAGLPHNFRDASTSGGTDGTTQVYVNSFLFVPSANSCVTAGCYFDRWRKKPTLITPGKVSSSSPPSFVRGRRETIVVATGIGFESIQRSNDER